MTPAQIAALREVSERCRAAGSRVWLEPAAVLALLDALDRSLLVDEGVTVQDYACAGAKRCAKLRPSNQQPERTK